MPAENPETMAFVDSLKKMLGDKQEEAQESKKKVIELESEIQLERSEKIDLEKENNYLRMTAMQVRKDDLERERQNAEIKRLKNILSETSEQQNFYNGTMGNSSIKRDPAPLSKRISFSAYQKPSEWLLAPDSPQTRV